MGLERTSFLVMENVGVVEVCVNVSFPTIDCPIAFPFDVVLSTDDGTAGNMPVYISYIYVAITVSITVYTTDYGPLSKVLMFGACEIRNCVTITIRDDEVDELNTEFFTYHLRRTTSLDPRIELDPVDGRIEIVDNDGGMWHIKLVIVSDSFSLFQST